MKKISFYIILTLLLTACSLSKSNLKDLEISQSKLIETTSNLTSADSLLNKKVADLENQIIYLENKIDLQDEQISFYTERLETMLDIISNNSKNINALQGKKSQKSLSTLPKETIQVKPEYLYKQARSHYIQKKLAKAKIEFNEFQQLYPQHELALNSAYWLAEIEFDLGNYYLALEKFQVISNNEQNLEKALDSKLKIAIINKMLGNYKQAIEEATIILQNYPEYIRINKVKAFLEELKS